MTMYLVQDQDKKEGFDLLLSTLQTIKKIITGDLKWS